MFIAETITAASFHNRLSTELGPLMLYALALSVKKNRANMSGVNASAWITNKPLAGKRMTKSTRPLQ